MARSPHEVRARGGELAVDLRRKVDDLRQTAADGHASPGENHGDEILATIQQGHGQEVRITWRAARSTPGLALQLWQADFGGTPYPIRGVGITISMYGLTELAEGVAAALELAKQHVADRNARHRAEREGRR